VLAFLITVAAIRIRRSDLAGNPDSGAASL